MFTVLIAEKEHINAIQKENRLFFEPFLENKELAFCCWNPDGQSLNDSVPGLMDAVGRKKKWRAIVINPCKGEQLKERNPFDVVDYSDLSSLTMPSRQTEDENTWDAWEEEWRNYFKSYTEIKESIYKNAQEQPLQRLSTWLCYQPEDFILNDVQEKQDVHDWAMEQVDRDVPKPSARLELMERDQYKLELRMKEMIRKEFIAGARLNIEHPAELHCVSLRTAETNFFNPEHYWNIRSESDYSMFADRNMYYDKMRFVVYDLLPQTHRDYRTDYIRFLASVLILSSNLTPSSAMQPRRLYQFEIESDDTPLWTIVTSYDRKLSATAEVISNEMDKIRSEIPADLTDKEVEKILSTPKDVIVALDESCNFKKVCVDKDYGLFVDQPTNEFHKWNQSYDVSKSALSYIAKQQSRSVRKSVGQAKQTSSILDVDVSRLTQFQIEDIREYTNQLENEMIESMPPNLTDMSTYTERLEKASDEVKKVIRRRMTLKTNLILGAVLLFLYIMCFLPFVFKNGASPSMSSASITLAGIMVVLLVGIMVITLLFLRIPIKNAVRNYNDVAQECINDILSSLRHFAKYLSTLCNVRRGHAIQNYANKNMDDYTLSLRIRQRHYEDIQKKRAYLAEEYRDYLGDKTFCDETMARPYEYDFDQRKEYEYPAPYLAGDTRQIEFISFGNFVTVPSSYITKMIVRMEGIYEK